MGLLVIDDDDMVRRALCRTLRRKYAVMETRDAETALAFVDSGLRFDAIITDLHLSGMSGHELLVELERIAPLQARRVVILSGSPSELVDDELVLSHRFLEKPATFAQLEAAILGVIGVAARAA